MVKILIKKEEVVRRYDLLVNTRFLAVNAFLFAALFLKIFFQVPFPDLLFYLIAFMVLSTIVYDLLLRKIETPTTSQIINGYFIYLLFDLIILTLIISILGGVTWIGFIFYALYFYIALLLFPRAYYLFIIFYCSLLYTLLITSQYFGVFPYHGLFPPEERVPQNLYYVFSTWTAATIFLWILGYYGNVFYGILQGKIEELQKTRRTLEEERASLGIRVRAKTSQLQEERRSLDEKVKERTRELERERKELAQRISELERFHKVAVGREIKMRELKKEIEELKKETQ